MDFSLRYIKIKINISFMIIPKHLNSYLSVNLLLLIDYYFNYGLSVYSID